MVMAAVTTPGHFDVSATISPALSKDYAGRLTNDKVDFAVLDISGARYLGSAW